MPESPSYAHREALRSTISLHHHSAQLGHSVCGAGTVGTTGAVSGAVSGAVRIVYTSFIGFVRLKEGRLLPAGSEITLDGAAPCGTGEGATTGPPIPANALTPCTAAAAWPGDSGCGTSGTSVLA